MPVQTKIANHGIDKCHGADQKAGVNEEHRDEYGTPKELQLLFRRFMPCRRINRKSRKERPTMSGKLMLAAIEPAITNMASMMTK